MEKVNVWEDWQIEVLDQYLTGVIEFRTQQELADYLDKELNAVKIRLSRRRKELDTDIRRKLTREEYITILSNRFTKSTEELSEMLGLPIQYLMEELDELDCVECKEYLEDDFINRPITHDEKIVLKRLLKRNTNKIQISHILNRSINFIEGLMLTYERI